MLEKVRDGGLWLPAPRLAGLLWVCGLDEPGVKRVAELSRDKLHIENGVVSLRVDDQCLAIPPRLGRMPDAVDPSGSA